MRQTPTAGINVLTGWGFNSFTEDEMDKIHVATL